MESLLKEIGWSGYNTDKSNNADGRNRPVLPVEWVVDVADKDNDWFVATAYGYNDKDQTLHVMVPDRHAPTWTGDVAVNPVVRGIIICAVSPLPLIYSRG